jgi:hypothetical protein
MPRFFDVCAKHAIWLSQTCPRPRRRSSPGIVTRIAASIPGFHFIRSPEFLLVSFIHSPTVFEHCNPFIAVPCLWITYSSSGMRVPTLSIPLTFMDAAHWHKLAGSLGLRLVSKAVIVVGIKASVVLVKAAVVLIATEFVLIVILLNILDK